jgi:hypothetical protein
METPTELLEAMNSLSENDEWGGYNVLPEEILDKNDWRLKAIMQYRKAMKEQEGKQERQAAVVIRRIFKSNNINNPYIQAVVLCKLGARRSSILQVTKLSTNEYYEHVAPLFRNKIKAEKITLLDVVAILQGDGAKRIMKGINY